MGSQLHELVEDGVKVNAICPGNFFDGPLWADPEKDFRSLVPAVPMLWAAFAMVRRPADDAAVFGMQLVDSLRHTRRLVWRFAQPEDTLDYLMTPPDSARRGGMLEAEWRQQGKMVARSWSRVDTLAHPASARIDFPQAAGGGGARFELTVVAYDTAQVFAPAIWRSRRRACISAWVIGKASIGSKSAGPPA